MDEINTIDTILKERADHELCRLVTDLRSAADTLLLPHRLDKDEHVHDLAAFAFQGDGGTSSYRSPGGCTTA